MGDQILNRGLEALRQIGAARRPVDGDPGAATPPRVHIETEAQHEATTQPAYSYDENARLALELALDAIAGAYPGKLVAGDVWPLRWAETACPNLYNRIAVWLPQQISCTMEQRRPIAELQKLLHHWVDLHTELYSMFRESRGRPVSCAYCGETMPSAVALAKHLDSCGKAAE